MKFTFRVPENETEMSHPSTLVNLLVSVFLNSNYNGFHCGQTLYELVKFETTAVEPSAFFTAIYVFRLQPLSYNC